MMTIRVQYKAKKIIIEVMRIKRVTNRIRKRRMSWERMKAITWKKN